MASQFFALSSEVKLKYQRLDDTGNNGYVCLEQERYVLCACMAPIQVRCGQAHLILIKAIQPEWLWPPHFSVCTVL